MVALIELKEENDMKYQKPEVKKLNIKEQVTMASSKLECSERGCCVRSLKHY